MLGWLELMAADLGLISSYERLVGSILAFYRSIRAEGAWCKLLKVLTRKKICRLI